MTPPGGTYPTTVEGTAAEVLEMACTITTDLRNRKMVGHLLGDLVGAVIRYEAACNRSQGVCCSPTALPCAHQDGTGKAIGSGGVET